MRSLSLVTLAALTACSTNADAPETVRADGASRSGPPITLTTSAPTPGEDLLLWAEGAPAGATVTFAIGDGIGTGSCPAPLGGLCTDLTRDQIYGTAVADADGLATLIMPVSTSVALGDMRAFQAFLADGANSSKSDPVELAAVERRRFELLVENISPELRCVDSGTFSVVDQTGMAAAAVPGQSYTFEVNAAPGDSLSLATMMVQSNDFFYAPDELGVDLYDSNGDPITGEVAGQFALWDAGTEINQEPGTGADQAPRQSAPDQGAADPNDTVRLAPDLYGNLPAVTDVLSVELSYLGDHRFEVSVANVSSPGLLSTTQGSVDVPIAPGAFCVHRTDAPLFDAGRPAPLPGLEGMAEDGAATGLGDDLHGETGAMTPLGPLLWTVHRGDDPLFTEGTVDAGDGLEVLAEDGSPADLSASIVDDAGIVSSGVEDTGILSTMPGAILAGDAFVAELDAAPGDRLSIATMYVMSNDYFVAPDGMGLDLFDANGTPITGDRSGELLVWDAGTEVDQHLGTGVDQAPFQAGPNTGADQGGVIAPVATVYADEHVRITLTEIP